MQFVYVGIGLAAGLVLGGAVAWLFAAERGHRRADGETARLRQETAVLGEKLAAKQAEVGRLEESAAGREKELDKARIEKSELDKLTSELRTRLDAERHAFEESRTRMQVEFENLATKILEEKSKKFTDQNAHNLGQLLNPLREQLGEFKKKVEDVYDKESKDRRDLYNEISHLKTLNQQISEDALNLANALKGDSKAQGNWGELVLERVLEMSGLQEGREYESQVSTHDDEGNRYLLDVVVRMPEGKDVIIDAKVSLTAYERHYGSADEGEREAALQEHLVSVRKHIKELSDKKYDQLAEVRSLDYVLMFIPVEAAFLTAVRADDALFREAFAKNIILVCPSTLLVTLRTIANIWHYEYHSQNAQLIAKKAADLFDKFAGFVATLSEVRSAIEKAGVRCDDAIKQLSSGPGNLVKRAQDLKRLGVQSKKDLPRELIDEGGDEDLDGEALPGAVDGQ